VTDPAALLREQQEYYRARAPEYDDWFYRRGRYDRGREANARWLGDMAVVEQALAAFAPLGQVLELAAGTGLWTRWLAPLAEHVVAVDASEEMLERNRLRVPVGNVERVRADIFDWTPPRRFDAVVMAFWLSHVPLERFDTFWQFVEDCLGGHGAVFFVDSLYSETATAVGDDLHGGEATSQRRRLADGREFRVVKVFHDPATLERRLAERGWQVTVRTTGTYFLYGHGRR
jgi:SAM-dependent methyltransferase